MATIRTKLDYHRISNDKKQARLNCIKHILGNIDFENKNGSKNLGINKSIVVSGTKEIEIMEEENKFAKA